MLQRNKELSSHEAVSMVRTWLSEISYPYTTFDVAPEDVLSTNPKVQITAHLRNLIKAEDWLSGKVEGSCRPTAIMTSMVVPIKKITKEVIISKTYELVKTNVTHEFDEMFLVNRQQLVDPHPDDTRRPTYILLYILSVVVGSLVLYTLYTVCFIAFALIAEVSAVVCFSLLVLFILDRYLDPNYIRLKRICSSKEPL